MEIRNFAAHEDAEATEACACTIGEAFKSAASCALYCPDPSLYAARWRGIAINYVWSNCHRRIVYSTADHAAVALCYTYPSEKAPDPPAGIPPGGAVDLKPMTRPETAHIITDLLAFIDEGREAFSKEHGDFLYLAFLAVRPECQNRGLGTALLQHLMQLADSRGQWAYLEAMGPRNAKVYERWGFKVLRTRVFTPEGWAGEGSSQLIVMARPPQRPTD